MSLVSHDFETVLPIQEAFSLFATARISFVLCSIRAVEIQALLVTDDRLSQMSCYDKLLTPECVYIITT